MIKKIVIICLLLSSACLNCYSADTVIVKKQKGFLFLAGYNLNYDSNYSHVRSLGFSDYFFPSENFDKNCLLDSNKNISFKNGIRVEIFKTRNQLRNKAAKFNSTYNDCYSYDSFYVVPVIVDYKMFEDTHPPDCQSDSFDITVINGSKLRFYHKREAMLPSKITAILPVTKKKKK